MAETGKQFRYRVIGMDCAHDAREIEEAVRNGVDVQKVRVSVSSQEMSVWLPRDGRSEDVDRAVAGIGYRLELLTGETPRASALHTSPAYRRALWAVVILNLGYGVIEMAGGALSGSQALKSDALDFLGDGLITLLGVIAIGWGRIWRARSALVQGLFLGLLGGGVLLNTTLRLSEGYVPEAGLMGAFGLVALGVNLASTAILLPHRAGDANVRAVWLFSRNDAIGNLAVVMAALLVGWWGSAWPDIIVAFAIAGLFLQSSWVIVRDACRDLAETASA